MQAGACCRAESSLRRALLCCYMRAEQLCCCGGAEQRRREGLPPIALLCRTFTTDLLCSAFATEQRKLNRSSRRRRLALTKKTTPRFVVSADASVHVGVDPEAVRLADLARFDSAGYGEFAQDV